MSKHFDQGRLKEDLKRYLQQAGPSSAPNIIGNLKISQPVFSRIAQGMGGDLLIVGRARSTRYALRRNVADAGFELPIYEIDELGKTIHFGTLHAVWPKGFYLESKAKDIGSDFFDDLPYFLEDLRPNGFLGRLIPKRHHGLNAPDDIRLWSADHCLKYLARFGADSIGDFILGDKAFEMYLASASNRNDVIELSKRPAAYAKMAEDVLIFGPAGSSAGGEQPKFLATRGTERTPVIVKFSPPVKDAISERLADLLVCEHIAHKVLGEHGLASAKSEILKYGGRVFLEIERFDRVGQRGRRGLISLGALCAEFAGIFNTWVDAATELTRQKIITQDSHASIRTLEMFGRLIANTDMHMANLSFFTSGTRIQGLSPAYDMLPMMYAPRHAQLVDVLFEAPLPRPADSDIWDKALTAASDFWNRLQSSDEISAAFRRVTKENSEKMVSLRRIQSFLPAG